MASTMRSNGASSCAATGGMESTDTPDFFYDDDDANNPDIAFTDGIMGSTGLDKLKAQSCVSSALADKQWPCSSTFPR